MGPAAAASVPSAPSAQDRATFGIQPARAAGADSRNSFNYVATGGAAFDDYVAVRNVGATPLTLRVYATDSIATDNGEFALLGAEQAPRDVGSWVTIEGLTSVTVTAGPHRALLLPVHIIVPRDAAPGDHAGGIVASLTTSSSNADGPRLRLDQRIATRMFVRVAGVVRPDLEISALRASYRGGPFSGRGSVTLSYVIRNTGNVKLAAFQRVSTSSWLGSAGGDQQLPNTPVLLPGESYPVTARIDGVTPGFGLRATVRLTPVAALGDAAGGLRPVFASAHPHAIPWLWLFSAVLIVANVLLLLRFRLRLYAALRSAWLRAEAALG